MSALDAAHRLAADVAHFDVEAAKQELSAKRARLKELGWTGDVEACRGDVQVIAAIVAARNELRGTA